MAELSYKQEARLHKALVAAFEDQDAFGRVMQYGMGQNLSHIVGGGVGLDTVVQKAIDWCRARDRLIELLTAAREFNPTNSKLRVVAEGIGLAPAVPAGGKPERIILQDAGFQDVEPWRDAMCRAELAVCRIEQNGKGIGTGFLIGPSTVITNHHVFADVFSGSVDASQMACRFDHKYTSEGSQVTTGETFELDAEWRIDESPENDLDFAIIRLSDTPGESPVGGRMSAPDRGWLKPTAWPLPSQPLPLIVLQHAMARPMQISFGNVMTGKQEPGRVFYNANTEPGSSGSPCFTVDWQLVALHHWGSPTWNRGILFQSILERLEASNLMHILEE